MWPLVLGLWLLSDRRRRMDFQDIVQDIAVLSGVVLLVVASTLVIIAAVARRTGGQS